MFIRNITPPERWSFKPRQPSNILAANRVDGAARESCATVLVPAFRRTS
jgi:hypothetical protein